MIPILAERTLSQTPLFSYKRDKNIGNFIVRSAFQTSDQPRISRWPNTGFQVPMPNSPLLLNYLCFGARFFCKSQG